jgi:polysaccharide export outer membrane protein
VITAPEWLEEYDKLRKDAEAQGKSFYEFRIPNGSTIGIEVTGEPNLSKTYWVPPTGYVFYPYLNKVKMAGLTVDELKEQMERGLSKYLKKPEVLIHILQASWTPTPGQPFIVQAPFGIGEIILMGVASSRFFSNIAFTGKETLISVLGGSGLPPNAEWRQIRVIRRDKRDPLRLSRVIVCDVWDYFAKADVRQDIPLFPGDVVYVPERWSTDDQFWEDWDYMKRIWGEVLFLDGAREAFRKGGALRGN